jgi:hypothetical protein
MSDSVEHERELREAWQAAHVTLHALEKDAVMLARKEVDRRLVEMNQFRDQIERERGEFMRRDMYDSKHSELRTEMDSRLKTLEMNKSNLEGRMWAMGAGITALAVGINLLMHFLK